MSVSCIFACHAIFVAVHHVRQDATHGLGAKIAVIGHERDGCKHGSIVVFHAEGFCNAGNELLVASG